MQLSTFDLNLLRALDALLRERNVTRAAALLNVTQQAMSGTLKRLREHFSDNLLTHVGRGFELTSLGNALINPVQEVMLQIGRLLETTPMFEPAQSLRRFRIAMSDYATITILAPLMSALSRRAPGIVCDIQLLDDGVFRDLDSGALDFCLLPSNWRLYQADRPDGILSQRLFEDDFVCVVDANNPVGLALTIEEYVALPHNTVRLGGGVRTIIENAWTLNRLVPRVVATTTSFTSLITMVVGTPIIATVQRRLAAQFAHVLPIRVLECPMPIDRMQQDLSWHRRNDHDLAHRFMRQQFRIAAEALA